MQINIESIHAVVDIAVPIILGGVAYVGLLIKGKLGEIELKNERASSELREDFQQKHAENSQAIAVHQASDEQKFDSITKILSRMDSKLDRLSERRS